MRYRVSTRTGRRGAILATAISLMLVIGLLGITMLSVSINSYRTAQRHRGSTSAFNIAEAGLGHATLKLKADTNYNGETGTPFGEGTFTITRTNSIDGVTDRVELRSVSSVTLPGGAGTVTRSTSQIVDKNSLPPGFDYALFSDTNMKITSGNVRTNPGGPLEGSIHSNTDITTTSQFVQVNGHVTAGGTVPQPGNFAISPGGTITNGGAKVDIPYPDEAALLASANANGTTGGNPQIQSGLVKGHYTGNVRFENQNGATLTIKGVVFIDGSFTVAETCTVNFVKDDAGRDPVIVVKGKTDFQSVCTMQGVGGTQVPGGMALLSLSTISRVGGVDPALPAVDISANVTIRGRVYSGYGITRVRSDCNILGGILAKDLTLTSAFNVTYVPLNGLPPGFQGVFSVVYWRERTGEL